MFSKFIATIIDINLGGELLDEKELLVKRFMERLNQDTLDNVHEKYFTPVVELKNDVPFSRWKTPNENTL